MRERELIAAAREFADGTRCEQCERLVATAEDWDKYEEGGGDHLCWEARACVLDPEEDRIIYRLADALEALLPTSPVAGGPGDTT